MQEAFELSKNPSDYKHIPVGESSGLSISEKKMIHNQKLTHSVETLIEEDARPPNFNNDIKEVPIVVQVAETITTRPTNIIRDNQILLMVTHDIETATFKEDSFDSVGVPVFNILSTSPPKTINISINENEVLKVSNADPKDLSIPVEFEDASIPKDMSNAVESKDASERTSIDFLNTDESKDASIPGSKDLSTTVESKNASKRGSIDFTKREYKELNITLLRDLTGLMALLESKHSDLILFQKSHDATSRQSYVNASRDIQDIASQIVSGWIPIASACSDVILAHQLTRSLEKVDMLGSQLRATTFHQKNAGMRDLEETVMVCATNVVNAAMEALGALEAAKIRLRMDID